VLLPLPLQVGKAEVKAVFGTGKKKVAGCMVLDGKLLKGGMVAVSRGKAKLHDGELISLRRVKDDVQVVEAGGWSQQACLLCWLAAHAC
jgi:translation initiation factor IF-2